jgi:hypothetical protein
VREFLVLLAKNLAIATAGVTAFLLIAGISSFIVTALIQTLNGVVPGRGEILVVLFIGVIGLVGLVMTIDEYRN